MPTPAPLPDHLPLDGFSTRAAREGGVPAGRLRRQDLIAPYRGTRAARAEYDAGLHARCRVYAARMPPSQCFSHATAAHLLGIVVPPRVVTPDRLHIASTASGRTPRGGGIVGHRLALEAGNTAIVDGCRVPPACEVWCQLAAELTVAELIVAADSCLRRHDPLTTLGALADAVHASARRVGVQRLRAALPRVRARTDSPMESILRLAIVDAGLPEPLVNHPVDVGARMLHGDLVYPAQRIIIEYDGDHHRTDKRQYSVDIDRVWALQSHGWTVLRINRSHLAGRARVALHRIQTALTQRGLDTP